MCVRFVRVLVVMLGLAGAGYATDPILGTWKLNLAKSKFSPGPAPKSQTRVYSAYPEGVQVTIKTIRADGETTVLEYPANSDGKDYPVTGSAQIDAIAMTRISDYISEASLKHAGKVIGTATRTISEDGKTMTITFKRPDSLGRVDNVAVYDKQ